MGGYSKIKVTEVWNGLTSSFLEAEDMEDLWVSLSAENHLTQATWVCGDPVGSRSPLPHLLGKASSPELHANTHNREKVRLQGIA